MTSKVFTGYNIGTLKLKNRIIRSATYEGAADENGFPGKRYFTMYKTLAQNNIGMIITGFAFISQTGRAMQTLQAGIDSELKIDHYKKVTDEIHKYQTPVVMQVAHTGRQTLKKVTGSQPLSSTSKKSVYFRQKPQLINERQTEEIIDQFVYSAGLAKAAGFDGIQLHAAHGYLLHQFLLPETNTLKTKYGIDKHTGIGTKIIEEIFDRIKEKCGSLFPVLIKISGDHDLSQNFYPEKFDHLIRFIDRKGFDAIEISYGTMDYAVNIFRGDLDIDLIFNRNPIFKTKSRLRRQFSELFMKIFIASKFIKYSPAYNLKYAQRAKSLTSIPIITVGGFRSKKEIENAIESNMADLVSLSRPFICEPDFVQKLIMSADDYTSQCRNCNKCVFMCDSGKPTVCYSKRQ
ncbi:MAG: NADH:flavin oxidoreductase [Bacillota bacterium]